MITCYTIEADGKSEEFKNLTFEKTIDIIKNLNWVMNEDDVEADIPQINIYNAYNDFLSISKIGGVEWQVAIHIEPPKGFLSLFKCRDSVDLDDATWEELENILKMFMDNQDSNRHEVFKSWKRNS